MLEAKGRPIDRHPLISARGVTEIREEYIVPVGSSKALREINVSYRDSTERVNGDTFQQREIVDLSFEYPVGRTNKQFGFSVLDRNYAHVCPVYQGQEDVPADVLEVLVNALPLEVRRLLPALPKKKK